MPAHTCGCHDPDRDQWRGSVKTPTDTLADRHESPFCSLHAAPHLVHLCLQIRPCRGCSDPTTAWTARARPLLQTHGPRPLKSHLGFAGQATTSRMARRDDGRSHGCEHRGLAFVSNRLHQGRRSPGETGLARTRSEDTWPPRRVHGDPAEMTKPRSGCGSCYRPASVSATKQR